MQQWTVSSLGGYLAAPKLSREVRIKSQPFFRWRQFCRVESQFGAHMGDSLYFTKVSNLATAGRVISETEVVPDTQLTVYRDTITVYEYSNSVNYTGWLDTLSELSINHIITNALMDDMRKVLDYAAGLAFLSGDLVYTPTGGEYAPSYSLVTNGTPTATSTRPIQTYDLKELKYLMSHVYKIPYFSGDEYVCVASGKFCRKLWDDPEFISAKNYGNPQSHWTGEIGYYHGFRIVEENHILSNNLAGGGGEAVCFGADAVLEMDIYPEEIQAKQGTDYGRDRGVRWVFGGGFKKTWDYSTESDARIVVVSEA